MNGMHPLVFPRTVSVLFRGELGRIVAHNLDFDLVCVGETQEEAELKILAATKRYVEYGLQNNLESKIWRPAPEKFWDMIPKRNFAPSAPAGSPKVVAIAHALESRTIPEAVTV
jgi:hypothetical protein